MLAPYSDGGPADTGIPTIALAELGGLMREEMDRLTEVHPSVKEGRNIGLFGMIDLQKDRAGTPMDMAKVLLFLASDDADFVTGTAVFVDGGLPPFAS